MQIERWSRRTAADKSHWRTLDSDWQSVGGAAAIGGSVAPLDVRIPW